MNSTIFQSPRTRRLQHGPRGGITQRTDRDGEETAKELLELRRLIEENRKWRERCERLEIERDDAREQVDLLRNEIESFDSKWQEREGLVHDLQQTISSLQRQLSEVTCLETQNSYRDYQPQWIVSRGLDGKEDSGTRELTLKENRFGSQIKGSLQYHRTVAQRSQKYTNIEVPVISLTPREATRASFDSHMSERIAFQAGQVVREQIKAADRAEFLSTNARMFGSLDLLVQVKLAEARKSSESDGPNLTRLATACDLLTKVAATSQTNYVALGLLRQELLTAIFEGYSPTSVSTPGQGGSSNGAPSLSGRRIGGGGNNEAPSERQRRELNSLRPKSEDYDALTPYFVQVSRLRQALERASVAVGQSEALAERAARRTELAGHGVDAMADACLQLLARTVLGAWRAIAEIRAHRAELAGRMRRWLGSQRARTAVLLEWSRFAVGRRSAAALLRLERTERKMHAMTAGRLHGASGIVGSPGLRLTDPYATAGSLSAAGSRIYTDLSLQQKVGSIGGGGSPATPMMGSPIDAAASRANMTTSFVSRGGSMNSSGDDSTGEAEEERVDPAWAAWARKVGAAVLEDRAGLIRILDSPTLLDSSGLLTPEERRYAANYGVRVGPGLLEAPAEEWLLRWIEAVLAEHQPATRRGHTRRPAPAQQRHRPTAMGGDSGSNSAAGDSRAAAAAEQVLRFVGDDIRDFGPSLASAAVWDAVGKLAAAAAAPASAGGGRVPGGGASGGEWGAAQADSETSSAVAGLALLHLERAGCSRESLGHVTAGQLLDRDDVVAHMHVLALAFLHLSPAMFQVRSQAEKLKRDQLQISAAMNAMLSKDDLFTPTESLSDRCQTILILVKLCPNKRIHRVLYVWQPYLLSRRRLVAISGLDRRCRHLAAGA